MTKYAGRELGKRKGCEEEEGKEEGVHFEIRVTLMTPFWQITMTSCKQAQASVVNFVSG